MADKKNEVNWNQVFRCDRATFLASFFLQKDVVPLPGNPITRSELRGPASGPECIRLAEREKVGLATGTGWIRISQMVRKIKTKPKKEKEKKHARRTRKTTANTCYLLISPPPPNFLYFFSHRWCFGGFLFFFWHLILFIRLRTTLFTGMPRWPIFRSESLWRIPSVDSLFSRSQWAIRESTLTRPTLSSSRDIAKSPNRQN